MNLEQVLQDYFHNDNVEEMEFEKTTEGKTRIIAHLKEGYAGCNASKTFTLVEDVNWGLNLTEFYDKLDYFTNGVSYTFNNWNPQEEIERQSEKVDNFYGDYERD